MGTANGIFICFSLHHPLGHRTLVQEENVMFYVCSDRILPFSLNGIILVFSVSCSVSFPAHHQPEGHFVPAATKHDHLILTYKPCACTKIAPRLQFRPHLHGHCVFSTFSYMRTEITEVKTRKPKWPPISSQPKCEFPLSL